MMDWEAQGSKSQFPMYTYMDGVEVDVDSLEPISSPTNPNQTPVLSTENKLNANGWEIPEPETPIEPTGWGTDDEYMDGEESIEFYLICHEAMENEVNASHIKIEVEEMSPIKCYYTNDVSRVRPRTPGFSPPRLFGKRVGEMSSSAPKIKHREHTMIYPGSGRERGSRVKPYVQHV
jgi:hypothetical protein